MLRLIAIILLVGAVPVSFAAEPTPSKPANPLRLWEDNQVILDGIITQVLDRNGVKEYHINVNYYFKTSYKFNTVIAYGTISYEKGDRALFLLYDNGKNFQISRYSMDITKDCQQKEGLLFLAVPNSALENTKEFPRVITANTCLPENYILLDTENIAFPSSATSSPGAYKGPSEDRYCNQDKVLVLKKSDGSPACVKPTTAKRLVERGWAF